MNYEIFVNDSFCGVIESNVKKECDLYLWKYKQQGMLGEIFIEAKLSNLYELLELSYKFDKNFEKNIDIKLQQNRYMIKNIEYNIKKPLMILEMIFLYPNLQNLSDHVLYDFKNESFYLLNVKELGKKVIVLGPEYLQIELDEENNLVKAENPYANLKIIAV